MTSTVTELGTIVETFTGDERLLIKNNVYSDDIGDRPLFTFHHLHTSENCEESISVREFDTLSEALNELHRFLMVEHARSQYVLDGGDEEAFAPFI